MNFREYEKIFTQIREKLESGIYTKIADLNMEAYKSKEPLSFEKRFEGEYFHPRVLETWGELFDCAWFHFTGVIPETAAGKKCVLLIDFSGEGLVYTSDGEILQGLTSMVSRDEFPLGLWGKKTIETEDCVSDNGRIDIWVDAGCNDVEGQYKNDGKVKEAAVAIVDMECRSLFYDWVVCQSLYIGLCENDDPYGMEIQPLLMKAADILADFNEDTRKEAKKLLSEILSRKAENDTLTYSSIGHSHLDLLFLWPLRETIRKAARTFSTVLKMMKRYPEYKFTSSQPPLYLWMKQHYPKLYEDIVKRIQEGRWEVSGAFYVESDTNLPCGESLIRQLLYGKQYFKEEFGLTMEVGFLPDVFGYSAALPQLLLKSGTPYFLTQKLSMNDTNRFPRHTFWWQGIDGSRVLTHMLPEDSYNSAVVPQMAIYGLHKYKDIDKCSDAMQLYGLGDGGGGPGYEHFERKRRMKNLKGCPPHRDEFVTDFFHRIDTKTAEYRKWQGELYFEKHQGTYTSIAKAKRYNRKIEQALHTVEWLSVIAEVKCGLRYPKDRIKALWDEVLLYQFHDCLPGSSISRVYDEVYLRYEAIQNEISLMMEDVVRHLTKHYMTEDSKQVLFINPAPFPREEYMIAWNKVKKLYIPAYGIGITSMEDADFIQERVIDNSNYCLENTYIRAEFTEKGTLSSLINKETGFSMLRDGEEGNRLVLYPDELTHWDIDKEYLTKEPECAVLNSIKAFEDETAKGLVLGYCIGNSRIEQRVTLKNNSARLDFSTTVDWKEEYKMLRVVFPTSVITDSGSCEIQFGHIKRPVHTNTSWDLAKFEVCAHKWADISDNGGGIALLNDCKYGYKLWDNSLDLCLLRSQNCPSEQGDIGLHEFIYSIYPHTGDVVTGGVIREGYLLNYPLITVPVTEADNRNGLDNKHDISAFCKCNKENIIIETIKKSENGEAYVIRLYDSGGMRTNAELHFDDFTVKALCNLLEEPMKEYHGEDEITLLFQPFEVHTLLLNHKSIV